MNNNSPDALPIDGRTRLALGLVSLTFLVVISQVVAIAIVTAVTRAERPSLALGDFIALLGFRTPSDILGIDGVDVGYWVAFTLTAIVLVGGAAALFFTVSASRNPKKNPEYMAGMPSASEIAKVAGPKALLRQKHLRPDLTNPKLEDLGFQIGTAKGVPIWVSIEDTLLCQGPPRSGKGTNIVVPLLHAAPGALVTTSVRPDNVKLALKHRERMGVKAHVFDPAALVSGVGTPVKWDPLVGCESDEVVRRRVQAMMPADTFSNTKSGDFWASASQAIIGWLLHAAALGDGKRRFTIKDVWRWLSSHTAAREAAIILKEHPDAAPGWGAALEALIESPQESRATKWDAAVTSVNYLSYTRVQEMLCPEPGESFNPWTFLEQKESLFLLGTASGDTTMNRLAVLLFDEIAATALELAAIAPGERLSPPAWFILDEAANFVIPTLPKILSYFSGSGLVLVPIFQDISQARSAYGADEADAILSNCLVKVFLPGRTKARDLQEIENLVGQHTVTSYSRSMQEEDGRTNVSASTQERSIITAAQIAGMKRGYATVMFRELAFVMKLRPYTEQVWAKELYEDRAALNNEVLSIKRGEVDAKRDGYGR